MAQRIPTSAGKQSLHRGPDGFQAWHAQGRPDVNRFVSVPQAPHFLGILLISSMIGALACIFALLAGASVWQALALYSAVGCGLFAGTYLLTGAIRRLARPWALG